MKRPKVGICVLIRRNDSILLGRRTCPHQNGMWGLPGGHLEGGEDFEQCALREVEEETGIILPAARYWTVINTVFHAEQKHYVDVMMVADMPNGQEPQVKEPDKCKMWGWFHWGCLPGPLMQGIEKLVSCGLNPLEATDTQVRLGERHRCIEAIEVDGFSGSQDVRVGISRAITRILEMELP